MFKIWMAFLMLVAFLACRGDAFAPVLLATNTRRMAAVASTSPVAYFTTVKPRNRMTTTRLYSTIIVNEPPATIEKTDSEQKTTPDKAEAGTKLPAFLLRLWNDPYNKREFVARCLAEVCGKSDTESFQIMMHAHQQGMGIIGQYDLEIAELYLQSLQERGLLVDMIPVEDE